MLDPAAAFLRDPLHNLHAALPLVDALHQIDRSDDRGAYEDVLNAIGDLTGGLTVNGFRSDLLAHVRQAEQDDVEARTEAWHDRHGRSFRPDECAPTFGGYEAGDDAVGLWLVQARDALRAHDLAFDGKRIITTTRRAA